MTPSQKKTALLLERLVQDHTDAKISLHATEANSRGDVRATMSIRKPGMAQIYITPTGRPYFKEDEETQPAIGYEEISDALARGLTAIRKIYGDAIADGMVDTISNSLVETYPELPWNNSIGAHRPAGREG